MTTITEAKPALDQGYIDYLAQQPTQQLKSMLGEVAYSVAKLSEDKNKCGITNVQDELDDSTKKLAELALAVTAQKESGALEKGSLPENIVNNITKVSENIDVEEGMGDLSAMLFADYLMSR